MPEKSVIMLRFPNMQHNQLASKRANEGEYILTVRFLIRFLVTYRVTKSHTGQKPDAYACFAPAVPAELPSRDMSS